MDEDAHWLSIHEIARELAAEIAAKRAADPPPARKGEVCAACDGTGDGPTYDTCRRCGGAGSI